MKTVKTIFALLTVTVMSANVMAAVGIGEVRTRVMEKDKTALEKGSIKILAGKTSAAVRAESTKALSEISGRQADVADLTAALGRSLTVKTAQGNKTVSVNDVALKLLKIDETIDGIRKQVNDLSPAAKAHLDALQEAVSIGSQFIAMSARTSKDANAVNLYAKQVSILGDIASMETADIKAHTKVMADAVKLQDGPRGQADVAFIKALQQSVGGDDAKLKKKEKDLEDCI